MTKFSFVVLAIFSLILIVPLAPGVSSKTSSSTSKQFFLPNISLGTSPDQYSINAPTKQLSGNWAGYADTAGVNTVTQVVGSWVQPAVSCNTRAPTDQDAATWVGIDGFGSNTVEQTGTSGFCQQGLSTPTYQAWYEFYPAVQKNFVTLVIHPGDVIQASVTFTVATHTFKVVLTDLTTGKSGSRAAVSTTDSRSSAECIAEAPAELINHVVVQLPLAKFTKAVFGADNTGVAGSCFATIGGQTKGMGAFGAEVNEIIMVRNNPPTYTHKATPSGLTHSDSFSVTWNSAGP